MTQLVVALFKIYALIFKLKCDYTLVDISAAIPPKGDVMVPHDTPHLVSPPKIDTEIVLYNRLTTVN